MRSKDPFLHQNGNEQKEEEKRLPVDVFIFVES